MSIKKSIGLVSVITAAILYALYSKTIHHLNTFIFNEGGDGLKNYFNYLYNIKHGRSALSFDGMNYPYGEHIVVVDCHPLLSNILRLFSQNIYDISDIGVGILNFLMLISVIVCAVFVHLILRHYNFNHYISICGGIAIAFLSSNALLWQFGQYSLSYSCFFPIAWYLLLKFQSTDHKLRYSILILLNTLIWFYTHNYLGLIVLGFTCAVHILSFAMDRHGYSLKDLFYFFVQVILPTVIVYTVLMTTDTHTGRIDMPYFHHHKASMYSVFMPLHSFLRPLYALFIDLSPQKTQPWCNVGNYIGFSTNIIFVGVIFYTTIKLIGNKIDQVRSLLPKQDLVILLAAILLLIFSMAIPFRYNLEFLLPDTLKQFVSMGRFAWAFYFVSIVMSFVLVRNIFPKKWVNIILLSASALLFAEGLGYHLDIREKIAHIPNEFQPGSRLSAFESKFEAIPIDDYQAMVPIPYYHGYASVNRYKSTQKIKELSMYFSHVTGLPGMSAILSRPSLYESRDILQIFIPPYYAKPIQSKLNQKPLLLLYSKEEHTAYEQIMMDKAQKIMEDDYFELYKLPVDSIFYTNNSLYLTDYLRNKEAYITDIKSGYQRLDSSYIYYESYDYLSSDEIYRGRGALQRNKTDKTVLFKSESGQFKAGVTYNFSYWFYSHLYDQSFNHNWIEIRNEKDEKIYSKYIDPISSNLYDRSWALNEFIFTLEDSRYTVTINSEGRDLYGDHVYFDEVLIREQGHDVYKPIPELDIILKNNEAIPYELQH